MRKYLSELLRNKEIKRKLLITLAVLLVYRLLVSVPLPGIDMQVYQQQFGSVSTSEANLLLTIFTGGLLDTPSIVGLGIVGYINASIIIQLLTSVIPKLDELSKEGARGRQVIEQYTRYLTVPLSFIYGLGYMFILSQRSVGVDDAAGGVYLIARDASGAVSLPKILFMALVLTAGSMLLMWLAEYITENGIGNGSSLVIMFGILGALPALIGTDLQQINLGAAIQEVLSGNFSYLTSPPMLAFYLIFIGGAILIAGIVFMTESTRKLTIQYARRERVGTTARDSFLPIKLNQSGVLPIIFASAILTTPQLILPVLAQISDPASPVGSFISSLQNSFLFDRTNPAYNVFYFALIFGFTLFYAFVVLKPADVAENLQKSGAFLPGIRPGKQTEQHIGRVMLRLSVVGGIFLGFIALIPLLAGGLITGITGQQFAIFSGIGGTSILIVVGVFLDTVRQVNSMRATQNYERFI